MGRYRELKGTTASIFLLGTILGLFFIVLPVFSLDVRLIGEEILLQGAVLGLVFAFFAPLVFLIFPATQGSPRDYVPIYDWILAGFAFVAPLWMAIYARDVFFLGLMIEPPFLAQVSGVLILFVIFEAIRRTSGLLLGVIVAVFAIYPMFCRYMPSFLIGKDYSFSWTFGFHYLGADSIFGLPLAVFVKLIAGFMVFAIAIQIAGGGRFFFNLAQSLTGQVRGGPAKVAVFASAFFGSISGSVVANVATTGAVTIPAMKKIGYPPHYAGAVEACASTGGVLMPPIMGVTAFVMAEYLGIPYLQVVIAAILPSVLYYLGLFLQIDFYAAKKGLKGTVEGDLPVRFWQTLRNGWIFILSIVILLFFLAYLWLEAWAPWFSALILLVAALITKEIPASLKSLGRLITDTGKVLCELTVMLAGIGVIIGSLLLTGVGVGLSGKIVGIAGGNQYLLLILGALASMIMGMGLTITACYIILAVILAPGLVNAGLDPLAVHLYIMYWGMISYITPPVAIGAFTAASMAGASGLATGFQAMRLGVVIYFVPLYFVLGPALIFHGTLLEILVSTTTAVLGVVMIASAMEGYLPLIGQTGKAVRPFLFVSGILLAHPGYVYTSVGLGLCFLAIGILIVSRRFSALDQTPRSNLSGKR